MLNIWIMVCVLCWYPQIASKTVHLVEHKNDWFTASQTCIMQQGRLPRVNIYDHRLKLKDLSDTKNIPSPFWVSATYDIMNYNHCEPHYEDLCPDTFCQTITISAEKINLEWRPCSECNNFSCAVTPSRIYQEADLKRECKDWYGAFQECNVRTLSLASRDNIQFMDMVTTSEETFWVDYMPQINLAPDIGIQDRTCFYSFHGIIHDGNCSNTSMTTVCILAPTAHIVEQTTDWFTTSKTCTRQQGRLPSVNIYDHRLKLKDLKETMNISYPFWFDATYDIMDYNHCEPHDEDLCTDTFCQTIAISSGRINVEWRPCWECNNFSCAFPSGEIYMEVDWKRECNDWPGAFQYCKRRNLNLATRENVPFLENVKSSGNTFWLYDMTQINPAPYVGRQDRTCFYSFNGNIHEGNCSDTSITAVCILVKTTDITSTSSTVFPSKTVFTTGRAHNPEYSVTKFAVSTNGLVTAEKTSEKQTKGIWPILGSALGGFVVIIIAVLISIIVLRRRRKARRQIPDLPKKEHISMHQSQDDTCYETLDQSHRDSANVYCALAPKSAVRKD